MYKVAHRVDPQGPRGAEGSLGSAGCCVALRPAVYPHARPKCMAFTVRLGRRPDPASLSQGRPNTYDHTSPPRDAGVMHDLGAYTRRLERQT